MPYNREPIEDGGAAAALISTIPVLMDIVSSNHRSGETIDPVRGLSFHGFAPFNHTGNGLESSLAAGSVIALSVGADQLLGNRLSPRARQVLAGFTGLLGSAVSTSFNAMIEANWRLPDVRANTDTSFNWADFAMGSSTGILISLTYAVATIRSLATVIREQNSPAELES